MLTVNSELAGRERGDKHGGGGRGLKRCRFGDTKCNLLTVNS